MRFSSKNVKTTKHTPQEEGLASASSVERLVEKIPEANNAADQLETKLLKCLETINEAQEDLDKYDSNFQAVKNEIRGTLEREKGKITKDRFKNAKERQTYVKEISQAIEKVNSLPDGSIPSQRMLVGLDTLKTEVSEMIVRRNKLLDEIEDLLPRHESHELGKWYEETRERTKVFPLYLSFFIVLAVFVGFIVVGLYWQGSEDDSLWYTSLAQSAVLRLALLGAFTGTLWFLGSQIANQKRIYEEYGHKETMMKTFRGFSAKLSSMRESAIDSNMNPNNSVHSQVISDILKAELNLAEAAIEAMQRNPAEAMRTSFSRQRLSESTEEK